MCNKDSSRNVVIFNSFQQLVFFFLGYQITEPVEAQREMPSEDIRMDYRGLSMIMKSSGLLGTISDY